jgi:peptidoglycan/LPS O-acetylase OafA/YrhL
MDHFRAIAVLWVLVFHGFYFTYESASHPVVAVLRDLSAPGWMGVHLFFVVSGYCITASARHIHDTHRGIRYFLRDRALRIFPVYWTALALTIATDALAYPLSHTPLEHSLPHGVVGWIGNLLLIQPYVKTEYSNVVYWSLVVELGFYAVVAVLLYVARVLSWRAALIAGALLGLAVLGLPSDQRLRIEFVGFWPEFVCGAAVFAAIEAYREGKRVTAAVATLLIVVLGVLGSVLPHPRDAVLLFSACCAVVMLVVAPFDQQIVRAPALKWMGWVGTVSYSLYLTHLTFGGRVVSIGNRKIAPASPTYLVLVAGCVVVALVTAQIFYKRVEHPLNDWRKHLSKGKKKVVPAVQTPAFKPGLRTTPMAAIRWPLSHGRYPMAAIRALWGGTSAFAEPLARYS